MTRFEVLFGIFAFVHGVVLSDAADPGDIVGLADHHHTAQSSAPVGFVDAVLNFLNPAESGLTSRHLHQDTISQTPHLTRDTKTVHHHDRLTPPVHSKVVRLHDHDSGHHEHDLHIDDVGKHDHHEPDQHGHDHHEPDQHEHDHHEPDRHKHDHHQLDQHEHDHREHDHHKRDHHTHDSHDHGPHQHELHEDDIHKHEGPDHDFHKPALHEHETGQDGSTNHNDHHRLKNHNEFTELRINGVFRRFHEKFDVKVKKNEPRKGAAIPHAWFGNIFSGAPLIEIYENN